MKSFIEFNNSHRTIAKTEKHEFNVGLFNLLSNSVFGKSLDRVRHRLDIKIEDLSQKHAYGLFRKPKKLNP